MREYCTIYERFLHIIPLVYSCLFKFIIRSDKKASNSNIFYRKLVLIKTNHTVGVSITEPTFQPDE
jgi:hypothetical protein